MPYAGLASRQFQCSLRQFSVNVDAITYIIPFRSHDGPLDDPAPIQRARALLEGDDNVTVSGLRHDMDHMNHFIAAFIIQ
jgi:hypothetical protein